MRPAKAWTYWSRRSTRRPPRPTDVGGSSEGVPPARDRIGVVVAGKTATPRDGVVERLSAPPGFAADQQPGANLVRGWAVFPDSVDIDDRGRAVAAPEPLVHPEGDRCERKVRVTGPVGPGRANSGDRAVEGERSLGKMLVIGRVRA